MDIVDVLLGEHSALGAQFRYLETAIPEHSLEALKAEVEFLAAAQQSHSTLEDELLFTALEPLLGVGSPELLGMRMMHEDIDRELEACRTATDATEAGEQLLGEVELARQHFLGEEERLFPKARRAIPQETRAALEAAWASRRSVVAVEAPR